MSMVLVELVERTRYVRRPGNPVYCVDVYLSTPTDQVGVDKNPRKKLSTTTKKKRKKKEK